MYGFEACFKGELYLGNLTGTLRAWGAEVGTKLKSSHTPGINLVVGSGVFSEIFAAGAAIVVWDCMFFDVCFCSGSIVLCLKDCPNSLLVVARLLTEEALEEKI